MPKFNLNWMYMIIALMLLGLWWGSDSKGAGSKAVTYSEFQDYVKKGYVSKVLGYEDKSIEAFLKPTAVGAVFGADSTKVGRNPIITSRTPSTDKLEEFLQAEKEAGHFDGSSDYPPKSDIFPAILIQILPLVLLVALWIFFMRRMSGGGSGGPGGVFNVGKSKAQLFEKGGAIKITFKDVSPEKGFPSFSWEKVYKMQGPLFQTSLHFHGLSFFFFQLQCHNSCNQTLFREEELRSFRFLS